MDEEGSRVGRPDDREEVEEEGEQVEEVGRWIPD